MKLLLVEYFQVLEHMVVSSAHKIFSYGQGKFRSIKIASKQWCKNKEFSFSAFYRRLIQ